MNYVYMFIYGQIAQNLTKLQEGGLQSGKHN